MHFPPMVVGLVVVSATVLASGTSIVSINSTGNAVQPSTAFAIGDHDQSSLTSSMSSSVEAKSPHSRETSQPLTLLTAASFNEYSDNQSIHGDTATDVGDHVPISTATLGTSPSPGLLRSRRANPVPAAKCAKSPLTRRIGYYQV